MSKTFFHYLRKSPSSLHHHLSPITDIDALGGRRGELAAGKIIPFTIGQFTIYDGGEVADGGVVKGQSEGGGVLFLAVLHDECVGACRVLRQVGGEGDGAARLHVPAIDHIVCCVLQRNGIRSRQDLEIHEELMIRIFTRQVLLISFVRRPLACWCLRPWLLDMREVYPSNVSSPRLLGVSNHICRHQIYRSYNIGPRH